MLAGAAAMLLAGCETTKQQDPLPNEQEVRASMETNAQADLVFGGEEDLKDLMEANQAALGQRTAGPPALSERTMTNCPVIRVIRRATNLRAGVFEVNFGSACTANGITRSGKYTVEYALGGFFDLNSTLRVDYDSFFVNGRQVRGVKTIRTTGSFTPNSFNYVQTVTLTGGSIAFADGTTYTRAGTWQHNWVMNTANNQTTMTWAITGSCEGRTRLNRAYGIVINQPLTWTLNCLAQGFEHATSGRATYTEGTNLPIVIDYGNGNCDRVATVTVGNTTITINL